MKLQAPKWIANEHIPSPERKQRDTACFFIGCVLACGAYLAERMLSN